MSKLKVNRLFQNRSALFGNKRSVWQSYHRKRTAGSYPLVKIAEARPNLLPYPIDMSPLLIAPFASWDEAGEFCKSQQGPLSAVYDPTRIPQCALVNWNVYLTHGHDEHRELFMTQANWLLTHKSSLSNGACGWPISCSTHVQAISRPCLSAMTQGAAMSVLLRAYQLTGRDEFMQAAHQAVRTFELDILDGGVSAPIGDGGVFFEEFAVYPATHVLSAHILAMFGLYDYVTFTHNNKIEVLIQQGVDTLHTMLDEFDTGYWTRYDFLQKRLAPRFYHSLHIRLLEVLAVYSDCEHCARLAVCWSSYQRRPGCLLRYQITGLARDWYDCKLKHRLRRLLFCATDESRQTSLDQVCIPITAFPVAGGIRGVLAGVAQVMGDRWKIVYLTYHKGREAEGLEIETFGRKGASPWRFPFVWLYCLAGLGKLFALLRHGSGYDLILPQDGIYTAAFATLIGKFTGIRIVCMDHGNVTLLDKHSFHSEVTVQTKGYPWYRQFVPRLHLAFYWASLRLLARIATRYVDQFLVAGDEVEAIYRKRFGVSPARIMRYAYMLDVDPFTPPDKAARAKMRAEHGIPEDGLIVTLINRLVPEKGLHLAVEGIARALSALATDVRIRVKVFIAGDGPLRSQVEADIGRHGLDSLCILWGEATPSDVVTLLAISDIFLYSGTRGTNYSMAVLEAMAAGCAVIASTSPLSNAHLLADGRGFAVPVEDVEQTSQALVLLLNDLELCHRMGQLARNYVAKHHSAATFRRSLLRATYWSSLDKFFKIKGES